MHGSRGIHIALTITPEPPQNTRNIHDGTFLFDVLRRHQVAVLDPNGLENPVRRLQPFPAGRRRGDCDPSRHAEADVLTGFGLNL